MVWSKETNIVEENDYTKDAIFNVPAGQWLNLRYGTPEAPVDVLLEQVPAGKQWAISAKIEVAERDV